MRAAKGGAVLLSCLAPNLTHVLLSVPNTFEPVVRGDTFILLLDMCTVARVEKDDVSLGLSIETPIDDQSPIVQDGTVPKPITISIIDFFEYRLIVMCIHLTCPSLQRNQTLVLCSEETPIGHTGYHKPENLCCSIWRPGCTGCHCGCCPRIPASGRGVQQHCASTCKKRK